jgi:putative peptidoglycan lipid II flippase
MWVSPCTLTPERNRLLGICFPSRSRRAAILFCRRDPVNETTTGNSRVNTPDRPDDQAHSTVDHAQTARSAGLVGLGLLASRILGLVRDGLLAYFLGTGHVAEAWMVALRIPNVLRTLLTDGSMNSAFVPILNEYLEQSDRSRTVSLINAATSALVLFLGAITILGFLASPLLVHLVAPGFESVPGKLELTADLMQWLFICLFLSAIAALLMGVLQSVGYFVTSSIAPSLFNVMLIVAIFLICPLFGDEPERWVFGLLIGVLASGVLQVLIQVPPLRARKLLPRPSRDLGHPGVRRMGVLLLPTLLGVGVAQFAIIANTLLASLLPDGGVAAVEYATRIIQVPYVVAAGGLGTAMLPQLSRQSARGEHRELLRTLSGSLRTVVFLMVPVGCLIALLAEPVVRLLFERGAFSAESTIRTADALRYFVPLLLGASALRIVTACFFSLQDTQTPVRVAGVALVFNAGLGALLMQTMDVAGLSLAIALTPCLGGLVLVWTLSRRLGGFHWVGWPRMGLTVACASAALFVASALAMRGVDALQLEPELADRIAMVTLPGASGLLAYLGTAWAMRSSELGFLAQTFLRRRRDTPKAR